ncbi:MAG: YchJ family protein [Pseudolysinimonas sp.]
MPVDALNCPCLSALPYEECCGQFHSGAAVAPTAERLMRSRYSAYALGLPEYLLATWHPSTRPKQLVLDAGVRWYRLEILSRVRGGMLDTDGIVEFTASYRSADGPGSQHEVSSFVRERGRWFYVDGA